MNIEYVIYKHKVCKIKELKNDIYCLEPVDDASLLIRVPKKLDKFFQKLMVPKDIDNLIKKIPQIEALSLDDKKIEEKYKELLNTGKKEDLVKIIKTTYLRNKIREEKKQKISEKDNNYFKLAENSLYTEIRIVLGLSMEEAKSYVVNGIENE